MSKSTISTFQLFEMFPDQEVSASLFRIPAVGGWSYLPDV